MFVRRCVSIYVKLLTVTVHNGQGQLIHLVESLHYKNLGMVATGKREIIRNQEVSGWVLVVSQSQYKYHNIKQFDDNIKFSV